MISINPSKWFDREFPSGLPLKLLPNMMERLRSSPAAYEDRVKTIDEHILKGREGESWSIQENVGHVLDLEPLWYGRVKDFISGEETLRSTDLANTKTFEADHNASKIADLLIEFRSARNKLVRLISEFDIETIGRTALHPRLKTSMNIVDLVYFVAEHDIHHLVKITELYERHKSS